VEGYVITSMQCNSEKCVFGLAQNVNSELALRISFGSEVQTFGAATQNARLAACPTAPLKSSDMLALYKLEYYYYYYYYYYCSVSTTQ